MSLVKKMDHNAYIARTRKMEDASLRYVRDDARQAIEAMPDGPNAGYYADEMHYCEMEIARRSNLTAKSAKVADMLVRLLDETL